jgi:hypothetical protein
MYRIQVFDGQAAPGRWRDAAVVEDGIGWRCVFSDVPTEFEDVVDALEVVEALLAGSKVRAGIFDVAKGELIYDSEAAVDVMSDPDMGVTAEAPWFRRFASTLGELRPDVSPRFLAAMGQRVYPDLRHEWPETVAWDEFGQWPPTGLSGR